jgi:hypothetical protein
MVPGGTKRRGRIWQIEITTLDVPGEPFLAIAVDPYSRLAVASAGFEAPGDIRAMLERACADSGCPDEVWIDHGFKFSSAAIEEWGTQHSVAIVWTSLGREHGA